MTSLFHCKFKNSETFDKNDFLLYKFIFCAQSLELLEHPQKMKISSVFLTDVCTPTYARVSIRSISYLSRWKLFGHYWAISITFQLNFFISKSNDRVEWFCLISLKLLSIFIMVLYLLTLSTWALSHRYQNYLKMSDFLHVILRFYWQK